MHADTRFRPPTKNIQKHKKAKDERNFLRNPPRAHVSPQPFCKQQTVSDSKNDFRASEKKKKKHEKLSLNHDGAAVSKKKEE